MTEDQIKRMLDACYMAKRVRELLPPLPEGVTPAYIQYMDVIHKVLMKKKQVKISDISDSLQIPRPGVTRTVKEMEQKGYLQKKISKEDGRITYISITSKGEELSNKYDRDYYSRLVPYLENISNEEVNTMISVIEKLYAVMSERSVRIE